MFAFFSSQSKCYQHSGKLGDIVYSLAAAKKKGLGTYYLNPRSQSGLDAEGIKSMLPLLENEGFKTTNNPQKSMINFDRFRSYLAPDRNLVESHAMAIGVDTSIGNQQWLNVIPLREAAVVIARSSRYQNNNFPWKQIVERNKKEAVFVGTIQEYRDFIDQFGSIPFEATKDCLHLAAVIAGCQLFIGNQSLPYALAEGLKINSAQETYGPMANCIFSRPNAVYYNTAWTSYSQGEVDYWVKNFTN